MWEEAVLYKNVNTRRLGSLRAMLEAGCDNLISTPNGSYPSHIQNTFLPKAPPNLILLQHQIEVQNLILLI